MRCFFALVSTALLTLQPAWSSIVDDSGPRDDLRQELRNLQKRIIGGQTVDPTRYPYNVQLRHTLWDEMLCGGEYEYLSVVGVHL